MQKLSRRLSQLSSELAFNEGVIRVVYRVAQRLVFGFTPKGSIAGSVPLSQSYALCDRRHVDFGEFVLANMLALCDFLKSRRLLFTPSYLLTESAQERHRSWAGRVKRRYPFARTKDLLLEETGLGETRRVWAESELAFGECFVLARMTSHEAAEGLPTMWQLARIDAHSTPEGRKLDKAFGFGRAQKEFGFARFSAMWAVAHMACPRLAATTCATSWSELQQEVRQLKQQPKKPRVSDADMKELEIAVWA